MMSSIEESITKTFFNTLFRNFNYSQTTKTKNEISFYKIMEDICLSHCLKT